LFVRQGAHMMPTPFTRNMIEQVRQALQISSKPQPESQLCSRTRPAEFSPVAMGVSRSLDPAAIVEPFGAGRAGMSITTSRVKRRDSRPNWPSGSVDLAIEIPMTISDRIRHQMAFE